MAFMKLFTRHGGWYLVETVDNGTCLIPDDVAGDIGLSFGESIDDDDTRWETAWEALRDCCEGSKPQQIDYVESWGAHYSAPGYMDQTDWTLADTEQEAIDECKTMYGSDDDEDDEDADEE